MSTVYYTASSLDGFIVDPDGSLDWLVTRAIDNEGPFGIDAFMASIGSLVMGSATYEWLLENQPGDWMYDVPSWVMTRRPDIIAAGHPVQPFAGSAADLHPELVRAAGGKDVWVMGGGQIAAQFVAEGLIDTMIVSYAPCTLGAGAPVLPLRSEWRLAESATNGDFVVARWDRR
ncbi:dihydrofolate reductase family protein [Mycolicibacterium tokaiense]|uniref:Dihydrofolate reductase n=1 Tax=Mycolicibacterium tokaiense TaxID=39695 RepID=A0A378TKW8_9MYCO|nr:dihydrofolate reductase family protein [Mycolicibacterium tokaiense]BBY85266.1 dihydrofolate reductase [Mycolicibacterium tokaiense]STZ60226.1 dihydrofolate reductase [Mycolicibacterium tokaiense]